MPSLRGALWTAYDRHYGKDSPVLVWKAPTLAMHPTFDPAVIEAAFEEDPVGAEAEYGAEFRRDVQDFLSKEAIEAVVVPGHYELPYADGVTYVGFTDPSGGSRDSYALAIAHQEDGRRILDLVRETEPPFSREAVTAEYAGILRAYGLAAVTGDRYAGEWPREQFAKHGITYQPSEKSKSELYLELLPAVNSGQVELLDHKRLLAQLEKLERRTSRGGKDSVDHPPKGKDDLANAAAGALAVLGPERPRWEMFVMGEDPAPERWGGVYFPPD